MIKIHLAKIVLLELECEQNSLIQQKLDRSRSLYKFPYNKYEFFEIIQGNAHLVAGYTLCKEFSNSNSKSNTQD